MIIYEVTADVSPDAAAAYERFQTERHIPDVMATGCFISATLERAEDGRYRVRYAAASPDALDRYLRDHAPALRADFAAHVSPAVRLTRATWTTVERWDRG